MTEERGATAGSGGLYDPASLATATGHAGGAVRLPDGRALAWAEYGSLPGVPCLLLPDTGSSRLAPHWLLHEITPPSQLRLLALDRPGIGNSDPVGLGGREDPVQELYHLVSTLAVGRVAVIGVGQGASDAAAFAARYPAMVSTVLAISPRMTAEPASRHRWWRRPRSLTATGPAGPVAAWLRAAGRGADLTAERTWERATRRMDPRALRVLGQRWQYPDFRQGLADDLNEADRSWTAPASAPPPLDWAQADGAVPVQIWHGRDETGTTLTHVRDIADLHSWQVTTVDGCSALFGSWQQILTAAANSFDQTAV